MKTFSEKGKYRIELSDTFLEEMGFKNDDTVGVCIEDDKITIEKNAEEKECKRWIEMMYNEFKEDESVFIEMYKDMDIMIDLAFERMIIKKRGYYNTKERAALQYALLKGYIIPKRIMEDIGK